MAACPPMAALLLLLVRAVSCTTPLPQPSGPPAADPPLWITVFRSFKGMGVPTFSYMY